MISHEFDREEHRSYDLADDTFISGWASWIRWVLVIPVSVLGAILIPLVLYSLWGPGSSPDAMREGSIADIALRVAQSVGFGFLFVFLGAAMAPKKQLEIALFLLTLLAVILLILGLIILNLPTNTYTDFISSNQFLVVNLALGFLGGAGSVAYISNRIRH